MAIKGNAYTKTKWVFEERPVASSKLNTWDDRIEAALELIHYLLSISWGGGSGVIRKASTDDLKVFATSPASLTVEVRPGYAFVSHYPYKLAATTQTAAVTPPVGNPRIDLVQARLETWDISVKTGTPAATPVAPSPDTNCLALAQLYLRPAMTVIKDTNDGTNGYVTDARVFL
ncbi:MAG: hypothetical protein HZB26_13790 [Candidatus Hydrogenedentes bacterium]|nr:hypothetical protein [Candidatus Hydrogenedentota bacterium]